MLNSVLSTPLFFPSHWFLLPHRSYIPFLIWGKRYTPCYNSVFLLFMSSASERGRPLETLFSLVIVWESPLFCNTHTIPQMTVFSFLPRAFLVSGGQESARQGASLWLVGHSGEDFCVLLLEIYSWFSFFPGASRVFGFLPHGHDCVCVAMAKGSRLLQLRVWSFCVSFFFIYFIFFFNNFFIFFLYGSEWGDFPLTLTNSDVLFLR